jgi:RHS repeat-associated protein
VVSANDPGISLSVPSTVERFEPFLVQTHTNGGGSEGAWPVVSGSGSLSLIRGWHDHCGYCAGSCVDGNGVILPCTDTCGGPYTLSCQWSSGHEFSGAWYGAPTWVMVAEGCGEATLYAEALGGSHQGPYPSPEYTILVFGGIEAVAVAETETVCVDEEVVFDASQSCGGLWFSWDFGDGESGYAEEVRHSYDEGGFYTVSLTAGDPLDEDETSILINVLSDCAKITGTVSDANDGHRLAQATVLGEGVSNTHSTKTDADGAYTLRVTGGDTYDLTASKAGYFDGTHAPLTLDPLEEEVAYFNLFPDTPDPIDEDSLLGDQPNDVDDPVNPAIGNFTHSKHLFGFPGIGIGFAFRVHYNSRDADYDGPLGFGWTHKYNVVLTAAGDDVTIKFGDGHEEFFHFDGGTSSYEAVNCHPSVSLENRVPDGWVADLGAGISYEFDASGRLETIKDLNGNALTLTHSTHLDRITDTAGREIDFSYTGDRISAITSPYTTGTTVSFAYDGNGDLVTITDPRGSNWGFTYDGVHRLTSKVDGRGITTLTNSYDSSDRVVEQQDAAGHSTTYGYTSGASGLTVLITPPSGNAVTHLYDNAHNLVRVVDGEGLAATFAHDDAGQPIDATDKAGLGAELGFDENGSLSSITDRLGQVTEIEYGDASFPDLPTQVTDPMGKNDRFWYDANGNMTRSLDPGGSQVDYTRNARGQVTEIMKTGLHYQHDTWIYSYSPDGLLISQEDPYGEVTSYEHDDAGRVTRITRPGGLEVWERSYDAGGNLLTVVSPLGHQTSYTYDANGNRTSTTFEPTSSTTVFEYDDLGRIRTITNALGGVTTYDYDLDSNLAMVTDADGVSVWYTYDGRNQVATAISSSGAETTYGYDPAGRLTSLTDDLDRTWLQRYDAVGRLTETEDPLGYATSFIRDVAGRPISVTDALGNTTTTHYDTAGRMQSVMAPDGSPTTFGYDRLGRLISFSDERGGTWALSYDSFDHLTRVEDPKGHATTHTYNPLGRRISTTTRDGDQMEYEYDADGRIVQVTLPGPSTIAYEYVFDASGSRMTVTGPEGTTSMNYDVLGRVVAKTDVWGNTVAFTYTAAGRMATVIYPGNHVVTYSYDGFGRLETITDWLGNLTSYTYDTLDRVSRVDYLNGTYTTYGYDERGYLDALAHHQEGGAVLRSSSLSYDARSQVSSETVVGGLPAALDDVNATSFFDPVNRILTTETDTTATAYAFSDDGNLLTATTGAEVTTYGYDSLGRLISVDDGSTATTYTYDARGDRIAKIHDGVQTRYLRDGGQIWATFDGGGAVLSYNIHAGTLTYSIGAGGEIRVFHGDPRGSVAAVTDVSGATIGEYAYDSYGRVLASTGSLANEVGFVGLHGVLTDENGLVHMQARFYDPAIRRFLTEDPLGIAAGSNLYAYVGGDPVGRIDPNGLSWEVLLGMAASDLLIAAEVFEIEAAVALLSECSASITAMSLETAALTGGENAAVYFTGEVAAGTVPEWSASQLYQMGTGYQSGGVTVTQSSTNALNAPTSSGLLTTLGADVTTLSATTITGAVVISAVGGVIIGRQIGENVQVTWRDPITGEIRHGSVDEFTENYLTVYTTEYYTKDDEQLNHQKSVRKLLARYGLSYADYLKISAKLEGGEDRGSLLESHGLTPALWDVLADYVQP